MLETLTKEDPERFARLLERIPAGSPEAYPAAVFRGLADATVEAGVLVAVWREGLRLGGSDAERWLVRLIEANRAWDIPVELIEWVAGVATGEPDPAGSGADGDWDADRINMDALNSTRGAAVLALGNLLAENHGRAPVVAPALEALVGDPHVEVRAAVAAALAPLLEIDTDRALAAFSSLTAGAAPALLSSPYFGHFLRVAVHSRRYSAVAPVIAQMLAEPDESLRRSGAKWLTLASFYDSGLDPDVDALLAGDDAAARAAAIEVFADNVAYERTRVRAVDVLSRALHDSDEDVRSAAERAFYSLGDEPLADFAPLISALAHSPVLVSGASSALHSIEASRHPLPPEVLEVCEAFVSLHRKQVADYSTGAAGGVMYVVRLTLRLHAQSSDPDVRRRTLDLIDQLVVLRAHNIESDLDGFER